MEGNFKMLAKTFYGMEDLLVEELKNLGAQQIEKRQPSRFILLVIKGLCTKQT